jgi:hypothetical protein
MDRDRVLSDPEFHSKWINSKDGHRVTINQPSNFTNTIWMFGGSALANVEVPDDLTIPSYLQGEFKNQNIRVENYGYAGAQIKHQFAKLKSLPTKPGDVVIFYDGINESIAALIMKKDINPADDKIAEHDLTESFSGTKKLLVVFLQKTREFLNSKSFFRFWFGDDPIFILQNQVPDHLLASTTINSIQTNMDLQLTSLIKDVNAYCKERGIIFIHVFQPILNLTTQHTAYEEQLLKAPSIIPLSFDYAFKLSGKTFQNVNKKLVDDKILSYNFVNALEKRELGQEVFLDYGHLNHIGNMLIAKKLQIAILDTKLNFASKPYWELFQSLDSVVTDHEKAKKINFKINIEPVCKLLPNGVFKSKDPAKDLESAELQICQQFFTEDGYCEHDQAFWKRVLIRGMLDTNCRKN